MTSTEPDGPGTSDHPLATGPQDGVADEGRSWWWVVIVVAVVVAVGVLVVQPWRSHESEPVIVPTVTEPPSSATSSPSTSASPTPSPTIPPVPGADAVFDDTSQGTLFVRPRELEAAVPAAGDGVTAGIRSGELPWGLPEGSSIEPSSCTAAVTVVEDAPTGFDARSWGNDAMDFTQRVTRLDDAAQAQEAFRHLVTSVDGCPAYSQINPGIDGATWTAQPAIEGQGVYPSIVQEAVQSAEGTQTPGYQGYLLVGNVIVSWRASALAEGDDDAARLATLGTPESLSQLVQDRAQAAVGSLG